MSERALAAPVMIASVGCDATLFLDYREREGTELFFVLENGKLPSAEATALPVEDTRTFVVSPRATACSPSTTPRRLKTSAS